MTVFSCFSESFMSSFRSFGKSISSSHRVSNRIIICSLVLLSILLLSSFVVLGSAFHQSNAYGSSVIIAGPAVKPGLINLGQLPTNLVLGASVGLFNEQDGAQVNQLINSLYNPGSKSFHQFLSSSQYSADFAPSSQIYAKMVSYFASQGLSVYTDKSRMFINLAGTVAGFQNAFSTNMQLYKGANGVRYYANTLSLSLPSLFAGYVTSALGFENYTYFAPHPISVPCPSCATGGQPPYVHQGVEAADNETGLLKSGINGAGQNIVLVDAFGDPTAQADLAEFSVTYNLPNPTLSVANVNSSATAIDVQQDGGGISPEWALETALDLEYSHAMAPGATIVNALGVDEGPGLAEAIGMAVADHLGNIISQSFGIWEYNAAIDCGPGDNGSSCYGTGTTFDVGSQTFMAYIDPYYAMSAATGITVLASTGDSGSAVDCCANLPTTQAINYPAANPYVGGVGGTSLSTFTNSSGYVTGYKGETVWNNGGGGVSTVYRRQTWQTGFGVPTSPIPLVPSSAGSNPDTLANGTLARMIPDVSADGDPNTGVCIVVAGVNLCTPAVSLETGGTSLSCPLWAGVVAMWNQARGVEVGMLSPIVYQILNSNWYAGTLHDVVSGNNNCPSSSQNCNGAPGYVATQGWDPASGVGTPNVGNLVTCTDNTLGVLSCS